MGSGDSGVGFRVPVSTPAATGLPVAADGGVRRGAGAGALPQFLKIKLGGSRSGVWGLGFRVSWGRVVPTQSPGRSPSLRGSWMELTHHPPPANLAAPEDGRSPDFVGSLERRVRRRDRTTGRRTTHPIRAARGDGAARRPYLWPGGSGAVAECGDEPSPPQSPGAAREG